MQKAFVCRDSIADALAELRRLKPRKVFLIRGKSSFEKCGAKEIFSSFFQTEHLEYVEWYGFEENPKIEDVYVGLRLFAESGADVIIAVGGGSVLDMAKLVRFAYSYDGELTGKVFVKANELVPLFAIPTTAGTGCEATPFAVCYKNKVKYSVAHEDLLPDYAVVYPSFSYGNSPYQTACSGFDALAQAIEAYWNVNASAESDRYASQAIQKIWKNLPDAVNSPNETVRGEMAEGAYWAGKAIAITKTTAPHAFSYAFTTYCNYPHGQAVALTFPFFFEQNVSGNRSALNSRLDECAYHEKMNQLLRLLEMDCTDVCHQMELYIQKLGLVFSKLASCSLDDLLKKVNLERLVNNPVVVDDRVVELLKGYLSRKCVRE